MSTTTRNRVGQPAGEAAAGSPDQPGPSAPEAGLNDLLGALLDELGRAPAAIEDPPAPVHRAVEAPGDDERFHATGFTASLHAGGAPLKDTHLLSSALGMQVFSTDHGTPVVDAPSPPPQGRPGLIRVDQPRPRPKALPRDAAVDHLLNAPDPWEEIFEPTPGPASARRNAASRERRGTTE
jgi:hypothetical protein